jgi:hypothetical protein
MKHSQRYYAYADYETRELDRFRGELKSKRSSISDVRELAGDWSNTSDRIVDAAEHITRGNFGFGAMLAFENLSTRMNRRAWLFNTAAVLELGLSQHHARALWRDLDPLLQLSMNRRLQDVVEGADATRGDEA